MGRQDRGENPIDYKPIHAFASSAQTYCAVIDACESYSSSVFLLKLAEALAAMYKDGFALLDVEPASSEHGPRLTPDEWSQIFGSVHEKLKVAVQYYKDHGTDEEYLATIMLPDDIADLYQDINAGLNVFKRGSDDDMRDAAWEWRFGFMGHYGRHMVNAIRTVHIMLCDSLHYTEER